MNLFSVFFINLIFISFITSCSENNSANDSTDSDKLFSQNQSGEFKVTGVAAKGPLLGATIDAYAFDTNGVATGASLSSTTTDANGNWSLSFATPPTTPLLIVSLGGSFIDESDTNVDISKKRRITLGATESLQGVLFPQFNTASITLLSHALLQKCRVEVLAGGQKFITLLEKNRTLAKSAIGFDPFVVASTNPLAPSSTASTESVQYAMYLGGMANVLNSAAIMMGQAVPDYAIMQGLIQDLSDGVLNGLDANGVVMVDIAGTPTAMPNNLDMNQTINRFVNNNFIAYQNIKVPRPKVDEAILSQPATNKAPVAINDAFSTSPDTAVITGNVLANDADPDGDAIVVTGFTQPVKGSVINNGNATFTYTPDAGFSGSDQFSYTVDDGKGATATANVLIEVAQGGTNTNVAPVANAGVDQSVNEQSSISLSGSGVDLDGSVASYLWQQVNGTAVTITDAILQNASFTSPVVLTGAIDVLVFSLTVTDNQGETHSDYVTVIVNPVNPPPVANAGVDQTINEGVLVALEGSASTDDRPGFTYSWAQVSGSAVGTTIISLSGATTATPSFTAPDIANDETVTFQLTVMDDEGASSTDSVSINMLSSNAGPTLTDDTGYSTNEDISLVITDLLANDTDPENDAINITSVSNAVNGSVSLTAANEVTFVPALNINGIATFTYSAQDSLGATSTNSATVTIDITPVNDNPVAVADSASMNQGTEITLSDMLLNDTDVENSTLVLTGVNGTGNQGGKVSNNGNGTITYIPLTSFSGTEDIVYNISDGQGGSASGIVSVLVNADTDGDSIIDADELLANPSVTDPNLSDSDNDGFYDQHELAANTNPNDLNDFPITTVITSAESTISVDTTWSLASSPYWVQADLIIQSGVTLTIDAGVVVKIDDGINVDVQTGGTLNAVGENPLPQRIVFTSSRDDSINADTNGDANATTPSAGNWLGVQFFATSSGKLNGVNIYYATSCLIVRDSSPVFRHMEVGDCNQYGVDYQTTGSSTYNANFSNINIVDVDGNGRSTAAHGMYFYAANTSTLQMAASDITIDQAGSTTFYSSLYLNANGGNIRGRVDGLTVMNATGRGVYLNNTANGIVDTTLSNLTILGTPREAVFINQNLTGPLMIPKIDGINTITGTNTSYHSIRVDNASPVFLSSGSTTVDGGWSGLALSGSAGGYENININNPGTAAISLSSNSLPTTFINVAVAGTSTPFNIGGQSLPTNVFAGTTFTLAPDMSIRFGGTVVANATMGVDPLSTGTSVWNIASNVTVNAGVTLTVTDNAILKFNPGIIMYVSGTLDVLATANNDAIFTSIKDDVLSDTNGDLSLSTPAANDWSYIQSNTGSVVNLNNAIVRYASYGLYSSSALIDITLNNSVIDSVQNYGIYAYNLGVSAINITNSRIINTAVNDAIYILADTGDTVTLNINNLIVDNVGNGSSDHGMDITVNNDAALTGIWQNITLSNIAGNGIRINDTSTGVVDPLMSAITINPSIGGNGIRIIGDATTTPTIDASAGANTIKAGTYGLALTGVGGSYSDIAIDGSTAAAIYLSGSVNPTSWNDASITLSNSPAPYRLLNSLPASIGVLGTTDLGYTAGAGLNLAYVEVAGILSNSSLIADPLNTGSSVYYAPSSMTVPAGVTLNLESNAILKMEAGVILYVTGALNSNALSANEAIITSIRDDVLFDTNADGTVSSPAAGNWAYIQAYAGSVINIDNAIIRYGQYGLYSSSAVINYTLTNSSISDMSNYGIYAYNTGVSSITLNNVSISNIVSNDGFYLLADTGDVVTLNINGLTIDTVGNDTNDRAFDFTLNNDASLTGNWLNMTISNIFGGGLYVVDNSTGIVDPLISGLAVNPSIGSGNIGLYFKGDVLTTTPTVDGSTAVNNINSGGYGLGLYGVGGSYSNINIDGVSRAAIILTDNVNPTAWDDFTINIDNSPSPYLLRTEMPASIGVLGTTDLGYTAGVGLIETYIDIQGTLSNLSLIADPLSQNGSSVYYAGNAVTVPTGVTLNLDNNAVLKIAPTSFIYVTGTLSSTSITGSESIITSSLDDVVVDSNGDGTGTLPASGDWNYIQAYVGSVINLDNAIIRYANYGFYSTSAAINSFTLTNSTITEMSQYGIYAYGMGAATYTLTNNSITNIVQNDALHLNAYNGDALTLNIDGLIIDNVGNGTTDHGLELLTSGDASLTGTLLNITLSNIAGNGITLNDTSTGVVDPLFSAITINPAIGGNGLRFIGNATTTPTVDGTTAGVNVITGATNYGVALSGLTGSYDGITIDGAGVSSLYFSANSEPSLMTNIILTNSPAPYSLFAQGIPANLAYDDTATTAIKDYVRFWGTITADITLDTDPLATGSSYWLVPADIRTGVNALTVNAGAVLKFDANIYLYVDGSGSLNVNGTLGNEVTFTSSSDDSVGNPAASSAVATTPDWSGLRFEVGSNGGTINYLNNNFARYGVLMYGVNISPTFNDLVVSYATEAVYLTPSATDINPVFNNLKIFEPVSYGVRFSGANNMSPTFTGTLEVTDVNDAYANACLYNISSSANINVSNWLFTGCQNSLNLSNPSAGNYSDNIMRQASIRGVYIDSTNALNIANNIITSNGGSGSGAGIYIATAANSTLIQNNIIRDNSANGSGGGVYVAATGGNVIMRNNLIVENSATSTTLSAGVYFAANSTADFYNNTIVDNVAAGTTNAGAGLAIGATNNVINVYDNIIFNNLDADSVTDISDLSAGSSTLTNNLSTDPIFEQGWYLSTGGAGAIDAGSVLASTLFTVNQTTNVLGSQDTGNVDLGYHYAAGEIAVDANNSTAVFSSATTIPNVAVTLTIILRDVGSVEIGAALNVSVSKGDVSSVFGSVLDLGDGSYSVTYTPTSTSGTDTITIIANGITLAAQPTISWP